MTSTIVIIINIAIVNTTHPITVYDAHGCFSELPQHKVCNSETPAEPFLQSKQNYSPETYSLILFVSVDIFIEIYSERHCVSSLKIITQ